MTCLQRESTKIDSSATGRAANAEGQSTDAQAPVSEEREDRGTHLNKHLFRNTRQALAVLSELGAQAHQIAEASLFSPKQYWRASALLCSLLLGLPGGSNTFTAAATALR